MLPPLWLLLSLLSPVFWAIVHVLDSYCVNEVFDRPWIGTVASAMTMTVSLPFLAIGLLLSPGENLPLEAIALCLAAGAIFMASQVAYFYALSFSESGIVAAYWNLLPLLLLIVGYLFLGERFSIARYVGCAMLVIGSVSFCVVDNNLERRFTSLGLMFLGAIMQVAYFLLLKQLFDDNVVYPAFLVITLGMILTGLLPLVRHRNRAVFRENWPRIIPVFRFLILIEVANLLAVLTSQYAVSHGTPSLVSCVEATIPAYTFIISLVLYATTRKYGEREALHRLPAKAALVAMMTGGVWLVS